MMKLLSLLLFSSLLLQLAVANFLDSSEVSWGEVSVTLPEPSSASNSNPRQAPKTGTTTRTARINYAFYNNASITTFTEITPEEQRNTEQLIIDFLNEQYLNEFPSYINNTSNSTQDPSPPLGFQQRPDLGGYFWYQDMISEYDDSAGTVPTTQELVYFLSNDMSTLQGLYGFLLGRVIASATAFENVTTLKVTTDALPATSGPLRTSPPEPTPSPTRAPTATPTRAPTPEPTRKPTRHPTRKPTRHPTRKPTRRPTRRPTPSPTFPPRCPFCPDGFTPLLPLRRIPLDYVGGTATCLEYDILVASFTPTDICPYTDVRLDIDFGAYCGCGGSVYPLRPRCEECEPRPVCDLCGFGRFPSEPNRVVKGLTCGEWFDFARAAVEPTICRGPFFTDPLLGGSGPKELCC